MIANADKNGGWAQAIIHAAMKDVNWWLLWMGSNGEDGTGAHQGAVESSQVHTARTENNNGWRRQSARRRDQPGYLPGFVRDVQR